MAPNLSIYGDCAECGFPVLIKSSNPVSCPFCATVNQPASSINIPKTAIVVVAVLGILFLAKNSKVGG